MQQLNLDRFIKAQERDYSTALSEIKAGKKKSHWVWYIFPQIKGLGHSETAQYYSIQNADEENISSSGYVVSTLEATIWLFLNSNDYNTTILKAVNLGEDTDTVAACVGGLLGIYYGIENIRENWKQNLKKYDYISDLCNSFDKTINE